MPNFALSAQLRQNFAPISKTSLRQEARSITDVLGRYGTSSSLALTQLKAVSPAVRGLLNNPATELALLFIDLSNFSVKTAAMPANAIAAILDAYYAEVLPIVYEFDGEVEKIIGDGIIAVFGAPFTPGTHRAPWLKAAERCADKIGRARYTHTYSVKIALHYGKLVYYHNDKTTVDEFYAIGKPMTELFRLEGEGIDKKISYYASGEYDTHRRLGQSVLNPTWWVQEPARDVKLKGVDYKQVIDLR
ncbi:MAG: adenylate/guanylate cyclase domain-containing protein [Hymenobacter sp.]|nr:MAG: adenylate/guanylate cyclase domain-containing protein [Hymenobacter sp.]